MNTLWIILTVCVVGLCGYGVFVVYMIGYLHGTRDEMKRNYDEPRS